jgi:peptide/nickel transport system ATP-binding protein
LIQRTRHLTRPSNKCCCKPLKNRVKYLPTVTDFMEEKMDAAGNWIITAKVHASVEEMLRRSIEPPEAYDRRLQHLMQQDPLLVVKGLKKYFTRAKRFLSRRESVTRAVDDVSFDVYLGETLGVVGESGCGKTTLTRTILRLKKPTEGQVFFKEQDLNQLSSSRLRRLRRQIQIVFQDPYTSLNPRMTVETCLSEPLRVYGIFKTKRQSVDSTHAVVLLISQRCRWSLFYIC